MKKLFIVNFILVIVILTLGNVNAATMNNYNWELHFENIEIEDGSIAAIQEPTIIGSTNSEIVYSVDFNAPGEFYEFTVDVINNGTLDAIVGDINQNKLTAEQEKYLSYKLTYLDGTEVNKDDLLKAGTKNRLRIRLEFRQDITIDDLPKEDTNIFFSLNSCYVQANENVTEIKNERSK